jgi:DNA gyrase subunit A
MGRVATGVRGIRLRAGDVVVGMVIVPEAARDETTILAVTERGRGKRSEVDDYRLQTRGGQGVINFRINEQTGRVVAIKGVTQEHELMVITRNGVVNRQRISGIRVIGRNTQGVRVLTLDEGDELVDIARLIPEDEEDLPPEVGAIAGEDASDILGDEPVEDEPEDEGLEEEGADDDV